jgi:hypothetical protein
VSAQPVYYDENSTEPPLITFNQQIRREAAKIYYLHNTFRIVTHDFHPRVLLHLHRHLTAANIEYKKFWATAHVFAHAQIQPQSSWENLKVWLRLCHQEGRSSYGFTHPRVMPRALRKARGWHVVGGMFHLAHQLWETPWGVVERVLDEQRFVLARVINRTNVHDRNLIPLASTPPAASSSS